VTATSPSPAQPRSRRGLVIGIIAVAVIAVVAFGVWYVFIRSDAPPELDLATVTTTTGAGGSTGAGDRAALAGTWTLTPDSTAGYRIEEKLFGVESNTAAARTNEVTGSVTIEGTTVTEAEITVDMASMTSVGTKLDEAIADRRDEQFRGRIMNTDEFPTATFTLTEPIELEPVPADGTEAEYSATGELTMHGTTKTVTIPIKAKRLDNVIAIQGITDITFSDYNIDDPSGGPASVGDSGQLEFLVQAEPSSA
jgi:polyisoprenoid-binding protein YceI